MSQYAGIDIGKEHTFSCVLDVKKKAFTYPAGRMSLDETEVWLEGFTELAGACIDGPPNCNTGILARRLPANSPHSTDKRLTEFHLGIGGCYSTRSQPPGAGATNEWMQSSFNLFDRLSASGRWTLDRGERTGQLIETHPTYAFKALLGCNQSVVDGINRYKLDPAHRLRRKHSSAGHSQRIELLMGLCHEMSLVPDELTLAKWRSRIDWADAAICAFVSYWHQKRDPELFSPGDTSEGAIYFRVPRSPLSVTDYAVSGTGSKRASSSRSGSSGSNAAPSRLLNGTRVPANAIILRLGAKRRAGGATDSLSQLDTIDTILSSEDLKEFWLPIGSKVMANLCKNLELVNGRLYLAFGEQLRVELVVDDCRFSDTPQDYPSKEQNPWPFEMCIGWVRVVEAVECDNTNFYVTSGNDWQKGFTPSQTSLLWAVVEVNSNSPTEVEVASNNASEKANGVDGNSDSVLKLRKDQLRKSFLADGEQSLEARIERYIEVNHQNMVAMHHFTLASRECHECYRDGHFIAAIMLAQAVAEGILKFMVERNDIDIDSPNRDKRLAELSNRGFLDSKSQECFNRIFHSFRNDYHHMSSVGSIDHKALAKRNIQDLASIEQYVFHCDLDQGAAVPRFPQYRDIDEPGMMAADVDFT
jgi:predicted RNase H-like nuclease